MVQHRTPNQLHASMYIKQASETAEQRRKCTWRFDQTTDTDYWVSDCGVRYVFTDGGPTDNGMVYCFKCGKLLDEEMDMLYHVTEAMQRRDFIHCPKCGEVIVELADDRQSIIVSASCKCGPVNFERAGE